jgi:hypothetical protein
MRLLIIATGLLVLGPWFCGCAALNRPDAATVSLCKRGFANNHDWTRAWRFSRDARKLRQQFAGMPCPPTVWFRDARHHGFASCSRDRCEDDRCLWLVRLFEMENGRWSLANDYHLGVQNRN